MSLCSHLPVFILSLMVLFLLFVNIPPSERMKINIVFTFITAFIMTYYFVTSISEGFQFEVTPWKTQCLKRNAVEGGECGCCPKGFSGQNVGFRYIADKDRLNNGPCPVPTQFLKNNPDNYELQGNSWVNEEYNTSDSYCTNCDNNSNNYNTLKTEWSQKQPYESFCGSCVA